MGSQYTLTATLTGVRTVWHYTADENEEVELSYSLNVSDGGKAKLVLVAPDGTVTTLIENANHEEGELQMEIITLQEGENKIKIVGYEAPKFELALNVAVGDMGT